MLLAIIYQNVEDFKLVVVQSNLRRFAAFLDAV